MSDIRTRALHTPVPVAQYLFTRLHQLGIRSVHGVPGDFNLVALDYVPKAGLKWVGSVNELNAAYAADGYARYSPGSAGTGTGTGTGGGSPYPLLNQLTNADFIQYQTRLLGSDNRNITTDYAAPALDVPTFSRRVRQASTTTTAGTGTSTTTATNNRITTGFGGTSASAADAASFTGIPLADVWAVLARCDLRWFCSEAGAALADVPDVPLPEADTLAPVRFLATWDATLLVHARRTQMLPEEYRPHVFATSMPRSVPTFLVDGQVAGTWAFDGRRVVTCPFRDLPAADERAVEAEAEQLSAFHVAPD